MICSFHTCSVCQCEDKEVPLPWKQDSEFDSIDKKINEPFYRWIEKYNYSSPNWLVETELDSTNGVYVNLLDNSEAFTGYQGQHIWNAIYHENCFSDKLNQLCKEEKVFYKIISGLHSNINLHLSKNYLDIEKNISSVNRTMLYDRVSKHPDRVNNLFFLYSLLIKAFHKAEDEITSYNYYTGSTVDDVQTREMLSDIYTMANETRIKEGCDDCLQGNALRDNFQPVNDNFLNFNSNKLDDLKLRFRNVSQIIDCVSCQKCKLHGKLQLYGLATMFKILFTNTKNQSGLSLKRNELIAFINLVGKVSSSVHYLYEINKETAQVGYRNEMICFGLKTFVCSFLLMLLVYLNLKFIKNRNNPKTQRQRNVKAGDLRNTQMTEGEIVEYLNKIKDKEDYVLSKKNE